MKTPREVIEQVEHDAGDNHIQQRTLDGMLTVLKVLHRGATFTEAVRVSKVEKRTVSDWRNKFFAFNQAVKALLEVNTEKRKTGREEKKWTEKEEAGLVLDFDSPIPDPGGLVAFRWDYFGRPTPIHQQGAVKALE